MEDSLFDHYAKIFLEKGKNLYMVGGTSRDLLLGRPYHDHDFVTDATPKEMKEIIPEASFTFEKFGSVRINLPKKEEIDFTTLRVEGPYLDFRHPSSVRFVTSIKEDYVRRDFTINALYINRNYEVSDYCGGLSDLKNKIIRFIGDPNKRVQEDPLRILRAYRFAESLGFRIEEESLKAIKANEPLLDKLKKEKVEEERKKR